MVNFRKFIKKPGEKTPGKVRQRAGKDKPAKKIDIFFSLEKGINSEFVSVKNGVVEQCLREDIYQSSGDVVVIRITDSKNIDKIVISNSKGKKLRNYIARDIGELSSFRKIEKNTYIACPNNLKSFKSATNIVPVAPLAGFIKNYLKSKKVIDPVCFVFFKTSISNVFLKIDGLYKTLMIFDSADVQEFEERLRDAAGDLPIYEIDLIGLADWCSKNKILKYQIKHEIGGIETEFLAKPLFIGGISLIVVSSIALVGTDSLLSRSKTELQNISAKMQIPGRMEKDLNSQYSPLFASKESINLNSILSDAQTVWRPGTVVDLNYDYPSNSGVRNAITVKINNFKNPFGGQSFWYKTGLIKEVLYQKAPKGLDDGVLLYQNGDLYEIIFKFKK